MGQKIIIVSGKGGVGKSTLAAALAQDSARSGKRTLLVELGDQSYFQYIYKCNVGYEPNEIRPNLSVSIWSGDQCLREYIYYLLKIRRIVDLFFDNKVMRTFIRSAPALKELALLGKITSGVRQWGPPLLYDILIVDAYSTGHLLALLRAPIGMADLFESGPMGEQCRKMIEVIRNPEVCEFKIVTLPEELPATEAIDLRADLKKWVSQEAQVICNRVYDSQLSDERLMQIIQSDVPRDTQKFAQFILNAQTRQEEPMKILKSHFSQIKYLPLVLATESDKIIDEIERSLNY